MLNITGNLTERDRKANKVKFQQSAAVSHEFNEDEKPSAPLGSIENPYKLGEKGSGVRLQSVVQDFDKLKEQCLADGKLFEDPEFPADDTSIFNSEKPKQYKEEIIWKRPKEIVKNPKFYVDGASRFDVKQGNFGNCWMVSSVSTLAMNRNLLEKVIPPGQECFTENYAGIFRFRFWRFGKWVEVVIDDRLPTYGGELLSIHSETSNEFWSPLLEKAYAKLHGTWELLTGGFASQALEDFTGGIGLYRRADKATDNLFDVLLEAQGSGALVACSTDAPEADTAEYKKLEKYGVYGGHAYSVTKVMHHEKKDGNKLEKIPLVRVRNPWGFSEWNGAWSDGSPELNSIPKDKRKELGFVCNEDGEFWISFQDWKEFFPCLEICYLDASYFPDIYDKMEKRNCEISTLEGKWIRGATAGGTLDDLTNFKHNPQYLLTLEEESSVIVALTQKNRRTQRSTVLFLDIGFHIYKLPKESGSESRKPLNTAFFKKNKPFLTNEIVDELSYTDRIPYTYARQIYLRAKLQPGAYCVIPSFGDSDEEGEFLLRVFSEKPAKLEEYDVDVGICEVDKAVLEKSTIYKDVVKVRRIFRNHAGADWELDWRECKNVMKIKLRKDIYDQGFTDDGYRSIVALLDDDNSGKIGYHEFQKFWNLAKIWMAAFELHDTARKLQPFRLRDALKSAGYRVNRNILNSLIQRYGTEDGHVRFDDFFMCAVRLNKAIGAYKELVSGEVNSAALPLDKWIHTTLKYS